MNFIFEYLDLKDFKKKDDRLREGDFPETEEIRQKYDMSVVHTSAKNNYGLDQVGIFKINLNYGWKKSYLWLFKPRK